MNKNLIIKRLCGFMLILGLFLLTVGCGAQTNTPKNPLSVSILKVGKADATIILSGKHALLIDTGEEDDGEEVVEFLKKHSISEIDAMVITHFDQDHVGGADTVLEELSVKEIYVPAYTGTHAEYSDFMSAVKRSSASLNRLDDPVSFVFGDANILIEPPLSYQIEDPQKDYDNNFSLITTIIHGDNHLVFMGDAEKQRIREWLQSEQAVKCDFLKVPHHGIYNAALKELFETLDPEIAVICSSKKNPAAHETLDLLHAYCPDIYETKNGNVTIVSVGTALESFQKTDTK